MNSKGGAKARLKFLWISGVNPPASYKEFWKGWPKPFLDTHVSKEGKTLLALWRPHSRSLAVGKALLIE
jgi:hypothetical protein